MITVRIFDTPVRIKMNVVPLLFLLWGGVTWFGLFRHPEREFWQGLLIGLASSLVLLVADFGHALAHIFSARYAKAPMDELLISGDMPRTLYQNNNVAPGIHRMRALGGPIFNLLGLLLSIAVYHNATDYSLARGLIGWSIIGHGLIFVMSLLPLPIVDGGTILKWTLVERGKAEKEADEIVRRIDWVLGIINHNCINWL